VKVRHGGQDVVAAVKSADAKAVLEPDLIRPAAVPAPHMKNSRPAFRLSINRLSIPLEAGAGMSIERAREISGEAGPPMRPPPPQSAAASASAWLLLALGCALLILPTMAGVARQSWSTEQGAHGPIVLASGIWLIWRLSGAAQLQASPGRSWIAMLGYAALLPTYALARIINVIEVEGLAMYGLLIVTAYWLVGARSIGLMWFPLVYLLFVFPPPDTVVAIITQPLKIAISQAAIELLHQFGYPIAGSGVMIVIGQYQLLVLAACAGLNSLISLSAIGLFYVYVRHKAHWRYALLLMLTIIPVAVAANFVRVLALLLITYHLGEEAAQGFLHNLSGLALFVFSVLGIFAVDALAAPLRRRLAGR